MARVVVAVALLCLVGMACATERMVAISEGSVVPQNWEEMNVDVDYSGTVNLTIALKRRNMEELEKEVTERSNPRSPLYGKWFSREEILARTAPAASALQTVLQWLHASGVSSVTVGANKDTIELNAVPLATAEKILHLSFRSYQEVNTKKTTVRAVGQIRLPESVRNYIQTIVGASGFPILHSLVRVEAPELIAVVPSVINTRYNVSIDAPTSPNNLKAVAEFQGQFIKQEDVNKFYAKYGLKGNATIHSIIGFNLGIDPGIESTLDVEYIDATSADVALDYYIFAGQDFCSDMVSYTSKLLAASSPGFVHSISYGAQTYAPICDSSVRQQIDNDFMTLSGKGISIIIASGDSGSGYYSRSGYNNGFLVPSWPAESPWCTAVGATYFQDGINLEVETAVTQFGSGGGFSWNENAIPAFQASAVATFFKGYPQANLPPAKSYNPTGRGTPDVSALGQMYTLILYGAEVAGIGGTSASTPVFAGMVTRLNDIRLLAGKATLGCINQLIYQNPQAFYDVTIGSDKIGQNTVGWDCQPGWDPVTGLGTPRYLDLAAVVTALP